MTLIIRKFIEIIVYGNVWVSLGAVALTTNTLFLMNWEVDLKLLALIFFATILSYSFQRTVRHNGGGEKKSTRHNWIFSRKKGMQGLILTYLLISIVLFFSLFSWKDLFYFSPLILIAFFYAVKTPKSTKALRDIPFLKIILIAISWASVSVLIPAYTQEDFITNNIIWLFVLNFLYIFALVIPFDIRDLSFDEANKKTIPQLLGVNMAKGVSVLLFLTCSLLSFFYVKEYYFLLPVYLISAVVVSFTNNHRKELFYAGGIDGLILLFPISTCIIKMVLANN